MPSADIYQRLEFLISYVHVYSKLLSVYVSFYLTVVTRLCKYKFICTYGKSAGSCRDLHMCTLGKRKLDGPYFQRRTLSVLSLTCLLKKMYYTLGSFVLRSKDLAMPSLKLSNETDVSRRRTAAKCFLFS